MITYNVAVDYSTYNVFSFRSDTLFVINVTSDIVIIGQTIGVRKNHTNHNMNYIKINDYKVCKETFDANYSR